MGKHCSVVRLVLFGNLTVKKNVFNSSDCIQAVQCTTSLTYVIKDHL